MTEGKFHKCFNDQGAGFPFRMPDLFQHEERRPVSPIEIELCKMTGGDKGNLFHAALFTTKDLL